MDWKPTSTGGVGKWGRAALPAEVASLPRVQMLSNGQATLVEAYGPSRARGGRIDDGGVLGAIVSNERFTLFAKLTGRKRS